MTAPDLFAFGGQQDDDAELIEAGRRWDDLRRRQQEGPSDEEAERLAAELGELMVFANNTPPATLAGCVVKLRILADPEIGMEAGDRDDDVISVRQVLAFIEEAAT